MKQFLENVWQDLREKRLWPVAVLLLIALVAIPVLLIKPAKNPGPVQPAAAPATDKLPALTPIDEAASAGEGSGLGVFKKSDPFIPPKSVLAATSSTAGSSETISKSGPSSSTSSAETTTSGGGSTSTESGGSTGGGSTGGGSTGGGSTGGGGGGTTTVKYEYVVDVTFTDDGDTRHVHGMTRLGMLPSESSPLLLFLGVDSGGDNAVFLVDSTLSASGEGSCAPSDKDCGVLTIGPGSVEEFTDGKGHSYKLRIDEIRKVKVSASGAKASTRAKTAHASSTSTRRFTVPDLVDLVTVASPLDSSSSTTRSGR